MNKDIYVSTSSFQTNNLNKIIEMSIDEGIENIELSACSHFDFEIADFLLAQSKSMKFLIHNYFPPPKQPFVLNLASSDPNILKLSLEHCYKSIDLAAKINASFYSVHAGFCFNARPEDLGKKLSHLKTFPMNEAKKIFINSIKILAKYAEKKNMLLAIENNVLSQFNFNGVSNNLLLGVSAEELLSIIKATNCKNIRILLDVGHLKVSSKTLNFSANDFIRNIAPYTIAVHLSDNNGLEDENKYITENSWFWRPIFKYLSKDITLILEVNSLDSYELKKQQKLVLCQIEKWS